MYAPSTAVEGAYDSADHLYDNTFAPAAGAANVEQQLHEEEEKKEEASPASSSFSPPAAGAADVEQQLHEEEEKIEETSPASSTFSQAFQSALDMPETTPHETLRKYERLYQLSVDFMELAKLYGRTIISELFLPVDRRTVVRSSGVPGLAGGVKYFIGDDLMYKRAEDVCVSPGAWLYGGQFSSDELAAKGAGHELKGATAYFHDHDRGLRVPMVALVDYRGFRVAVMPRLPIDGSESLVYGSCDGGVTVRADDAEMNACMARAAERLHLAEHAIAAHARVSLHSAGDVEGHIGSDGRRYVLDLARVFPAEVAKLTPHLPALRQACFFRLMRPELLQIAKTLGLPPLSSDAFTGWSAGTVDRRVHEEASCAATKLLLQQCDTLAERLSELKEVRTLRLTEAARALGVNVRHLGRVFEHVEQAGNMAVATFILAHIVGRVCKNMLRRLLRNELREQPSTFHAYKERVAAFFTSIHSSDEEEEFWVERLPPELHIRFGVRIPEEQARSLRTRLSPYLQQVFRYVCRTTGVEMLGSTWADLERHSAERPLESFEFSPTDIKQIDTRLKLLSVINWAEARVLLSKSRLTDYYTSRSPSFLRLAVERLDEVLRTDPNHAAASVDAWTARVQVAALDLELQLAAYERVDRLLADRLHEAPTHDAATKIVEFAVRLWRERAIRAPDLPAHIRRNAGVTSGAIVSEMMLSGGTDERVRECLEEFERETRDAVRCAVLVRRDTLPGGVASGGGEHAEGGLDVDWKNHVLRVPPQQRVLQPFLIRVPFLYGEDEKSQSRIADGHLGWIIDSIKRGVDVIVEARGEWPWLKVGSPVSKLWRQQQQQRRRGANASTNTNTSVDLFTMAKANRPLLELVSRLAQHPYISKSSDETPVEMAVWQNKKGGSGLVDDLLLLQQPDAHSSVHVVGRSSGKTKGSLTWVGITKGVRKLDAALARRTFDADRGTPSETVVVQLRCLKAAHSWTCSFVDVTPSSSPVGLRAMYVERERRAARMRLMRRLGVAGGRRGDGGEEEKKEEKESWPIAELNTEHIPEPVLQANVCAQVGDVFEDEIVCREPELCLPEPMSAQKRTSTISRLFAGSVFEGGARVLFVCTVNPRAVCVDETRLALREMVSEVLSASQRVPARVEVNVCSFHRVWTSGQTRPYAKEATRTLVLAQAEKQDQVEVDTPVGVRVVDFRRMIQRRPNAVNGQKIGQATRAVVLWSGDL